MSIIAPPLAVGLFFYAWMVQTPWNDDSCFCLYPITLRTRKSLCLLIRQKHKKKLALAAKRLLRAIDAVAV